MTTYIALLRGVNVTGNRMVSMAELREIAASLGFDEPRTLLNSGNLVFRSRLRSAAKIEAMLEAKFDTMFFVRTAEEWNEVIENNPFPAEAKSDPGHFLVMFFKEAVKPADQLQAAIVGRERVKTQGRTAYLVYPDGVGTSKLTNVMIEKALGGGRGTARNWNTVLKLAALAAAGGR